ncbi:MAG: acetolactate synthase large subunit [Bradyrhizobium sp.]|nr:MAG: acetolactate synthase large subunit [Bradyrhizobium sp.]
MNGAEAILRTLADNGVEVCFTNPGTSEMQFVAAFDREPRLRPILCLFEGVASGAADGYARIKGKPAATLLHLGPGLANASANLHNAQRAHTPIVNLVGDHATYHRNLEAPLASDIAALARLNSIWTRTGETTDALVALASEAVAACQAGAGGTATLILPADCAWSDASGLGPRVVAPPRSRCDVARIAKFAAALKSARAPAILMGGGALSEAGLFAAGRIARFGVRIVIDTFFALQPRGAGRFAPERLPYFGEAAVASLAGVDFLALAATKPPVAFFAYPGVPSLLAPPDCTLETLATLEEDASFALQSLADALDAPAAPILAPQTIGDTSPDGPLTAEAIGISLARHMPEDAIIAEDAVTSGLPVYTQTLGARRHDWLCLTGGAIGQGLPAAVGAAVAAPERKVIALTGDGSGAYVLQSLWTMAREKLDVVTIVCANRAYRILDVEFARTKSGEPGPQARRMFALDEPHLDWTALARGFGVPAVRCESGESFDAELARAVATKGPTLIEAVIP